MGNSEESKALKVEKPSSPPVDQANVHVYPDWAAMQAYYGPRVAVPPYFNPVVASGRAPHPYMWGPLPMTPPYGAPYAAIYAHGGVYAHPGVPIVTPTVETPTKSSGSTDQGLMKKLKGFDGLAMSIGNQNHGGGANTTNSQSEETEGSSDGSKVNTSGVVQNGRKRSCEKTPNSEGNGKAEKGGVDMKGACEKINDSSSTESMVHPITALGLKNPPNARESPTTPQPSSMTANEAWMQNERELKKERRKQSNRESARRSRLRKQAEAEELARRVDSLTAENMTLKTEINRLTDSSVKLKLENTMLEEKFKQLQGRKAEDLISAKDDKKRVRISTENLLSRVNDSGLVNRGGERDEVYEKNSKPGAKLHQLLDTSPRTNAVVAS